MTRLKHLVSHRVETSNCVDRELFLLIPGIPLKELRAEQCAVTITKMFFLFVSIFVIVTAHCHQKMSSVIN